MSLVLAGALISIALNPLLFAAIEPVRRWMLRALAPGAPSRAPRRPARRTAHEHGRKYSQGRWCWWATGGSGGASPRRWTQRGIPSVVAEQNRELVEDLRAQGMPPCPGTRPIRRC